MHAVLNWLWQGCVVALAVAAMLRFLEHARAQVRYVVCWVALLFVFVLPAVPLIGGVASPDVPRAVTATTSSAMVALPTAWWTSTTIVITVWAVWIGAYGLRLAVAVLALRRAKVCSRPFPSTVEPLLRHWGRVREHGRRAVLVLSDRVTAAAVLGCGSPVIAVAPALVQHLDADELDRIIVHEWGHVQRRDDVANAVQLIACVLAGWHPAVWWIDRRLQIEREIACDEMTVRVTGSPKSLAACLVKVSGLRLGRFGAMPAPGALSSSGLCLRIRRLLSRRGFASPAWSRGVAVAVIASMCALSLRIGSFRLVEAAVVSPGIDAPTGMVHVQGVQPDGAHSSRVIDQAERSPVRTATFVAARPGGQPSIPLRGIDHRRVEPTMEGGPEVADGSDVARESPDAAFLPSAPLKSISIGTPGAPTAPPIAPSATEATRSVWNAAAGAGVAVGRESRDAAVATAGFFDRFARRIADSF